MGGVKVSTTPNDSGACEASVSLYVIDKVIFKNFGKGSPLPPMGCAKNRGEANDMCSYDVTVRPMRATHACALNASKPFRNSTLPG